MAMHATAQRVRDELRKRSDVHAVHWEADEGKSIGSHLLVVRTIPLVFVIHFEVAVEADGVRGAIHFPPFPGMDLGPGSEPITYAPKLVGGLYDNKDIMAIADLVLARIMASESVVMKEDLNEVVAIVRDKFDAKAADPTQPFCLTVIPDFIMDELRRKAKTKGSGYIYGYRYTITQGLEVLFVHHLTQPAKYTGFVVDGVSQYDDRLDLLLRKKPSEDLFGRWRTEIRQRPEDSSLRAPISPCDILHAKRCSLRVRLQDAVDPIVNIVGCHIREEKATLLERSEARTVSSKCRPTVVQVQDDENDMREAENTIASRDAPWMSDEKRDAMLAALKSVLNIDAVPINLDGHTPSSELAFGLGENVLYIPRGFDISPSATNFDHRYIFVNGAGWRSQTYPPNPFTSWTQFAESLRVHSAVWTVRHDAKPSELIDVKVQPASPATPVVLDAPIAPEVVASPAAPVIVAEPDIPSAKVGAILAALQAQFPGTTIESKGQDNGIAVFHLGLRGAVGGVSELSISASAVRFANSDTALVDAEDLKIEKPLASATALAAEVAAAVPVARHYVIESTIGGGMSDPNLRPLYHLEGILYQLGFRRLDSFDRTSGRFTILWRRSMFGGNDEFVQHWQADQGHPPRWQDIHVRDSAGREHSVWIADPLDQETLTNDERKSIKDQLDAVLRFKNLDRTLPEVAAVLAKNLLVFASHSDYDLAARGLQVQGSITSGGPWPILYDVTRRATGEKVLQLYPLHPIIPTEPDDPLSGQTRWVERGPKAAAGIAGLKDTLDRIAPRSVVAPSMPESHKKEKEKDEEKLPKLEPSPERKRKASPERSSSPPRRRPAAAAREREAKAREREERKARRFAAAKYFHLDVEVLLQTMRPNGMSVLTNTSTPDLEKTDITWFVPAADGSPRAVATLMVSTPAGSKETMVHVTKRIDNSVWYLAVSNTLYPLANALSRQIQLAVDAYRFVFPNPPPNPVSLDGLLQDVSWRWGMFMADTPEDVVPVASAPARIVWADGYAEIIVPSGIQANPAVVELTANIDNHAVIAALDRKHLDLPTAMLIGILRVQTDIVRIPRPLTDDIDGHALDDPRVELVNALAVSNTWSHLRRVLTHLFADTKEIKDDKTGAVRLEVPWPLTSRPVVLERLEDAPARVRITAGGAARTIRWGTVLPAVAITHMLLVAYQLVQRTCVGRRYHAGDKVDVYEVEGDLVPLWRGGRVVENQVDGVGPVTVQLLRESKAHPQRDQAFDVPRWRLAPYRSHSQARPQQAVSPPRAGDWVELPNAKTPYVVWGAVPGTTDVVLTPGWPSEQRPHPIQVAASRVRPRGTYDREFPPPPADSQSNVDFRAAVAVQLRTILAHYTIVPTTSEEDRLPVIQVQVGHGHSATVVFPRAFPRQMATLVWDVDDENKQYIPCKPPLDDAAMFAHHVAAVTKRLVERAGISSKASVVRVSAPTPAAPRDRKPMTVPDVDPERQRIPSPDEVLQTLGRYPIDLDDLTSQGHGLSRVAIAAVLWLANGSESDARAWLVAVKRQDTVPRIVTDTLAAIKDRERSKDEATPPPSLENVIRPIPNAREIRDTLLAFPDNMAGFATEFRRALGSGDQKRNEWIVAALVSFAEGDPYAKVDAVREALTNWDSRTKPSVLDQVVQAGKDAYDQDQNKIDPGDIKHARKAASGDSKREAKADRPAPVKRAVAPKHKPQTDEAIRQARDEFMDTIHTLIDEHPRDLPWIENTATWVLAAEMVLVPGSLSEYRNDLNHRIRWGSWPISGQDRREHDGLRLARDPDSGFSSITPPVESKRSPVSSSSQSAAAPSTEIIRPLPGVRRPVLRYLERDSLKQHPETILHLLIEGGFAVDIAVEDGKGDEADICCIFVDAVGPGGGGRGVMDLYDPWIGKAIALFQRDNKPLRSSPWLFAYAPQSAQTTIVTTRLVKSLKLLGPFPLIYAGGYNYALPDNQYAIERLAVHVQRAQRRLNDATLSESQIRANADRRRKAPKVWYVSEGGQGNHAQFFNVLKARMATTLLTIDKGAVTAGYNSAANFTAVDPDFDVYDNELPELVFLFFNSDSSRVSEQFIKAWVTGKRAELTQDGRHSTLVESKRWLFFFEYAKDFEMSRATRINNRALLKDLATGPFTATYDSNGNYDQGIGAGVYDIVATAILDRWKAVNAV